MIDNIIVNYRINDCRNQAEIFSLLKEKSDFLNAVNVATIFSKLGKLQASIRLEDRDYQDLSHLAQTKINEFDMRNMTMSILWALGTLKLYDQPLIDSLCRRITPLISSSDTRVEHVVRGILIPLERFNYFPDEILTQSTDFVLRDIRYLDSRDIIQGVLRIGDRILGKKNLFFTAGINELKNRSLHYFSTKDLAEYLFYMVGNECYFRCEEIISELAIRKWAYLSSNELLLDIIIPCANLSGVYKLASSFSNQVFDELMRRSFNTLSAKGWIRLLDIKQYVPRVAAVLRVVDLSAVETSYLTRSLYALADAAYRDEELASYIADLLVSKGLDQLRNSQLFGELLWSFVAIGLYKESIFSVIDQECRQRGIAQLEARDLAAMIRGHAVFGLPYPEIYVEALYNRQSEWDQNIQHTFAYALMAYNHDVSDLHLEKMPIRTSEFQREIGQNAKKRRLQVEYEHEVNGISYDLFIRNPENDISVLVSVDGPSHYSQNNFPLGGTLLRNRIASHMPLKHFVVRYFNQAEDFKDILLHLQCAPTDPVPDSDVDRISYLLTKRSRRV